MMKKNQKTQCQEFKRHLIYLFNMHPMISFMCWAGHAPSFAKPCDPPSRIPWHPKKMCCVMAQGLQAPIHDLRDRLFLRALFMVLARLEPAHVQHQGECLVGFLKQNMEFPNNDVWPSRT